VMTAFTDLSSTVEAFQKGAFDYLPKPFDINAALALIQRAAQREPETTDAGRDREFGQERVMMQSSAPAMQEVFRAIGRLAASNVTVLVTGESGTGKELIARALHEHGRRAGMPFVAVNAAAIPKDLLEAELFGHERGAFTGATQQRRGRFEEARGGTLFLDEIGDMPFVAWNAAAIPKDLLEAELFGHERGAFTGATQQRRGRFEEARGGTLFLDEIGDMPFDLQTRLLRVLAEGSFYRVGGSQAIRA